MWARKVRFLSPQDFVNLRLVQMFRRNGWGFADQALISGTNFVTMILLARSMSISEFGVFTLAYTVLLFSNSVQSALAAEPHSVLGATRTGQDYVEYTTSTVWFQVISAGLTGIMVFAASAIAHRADWAIASILLALSPTVVVWQIREFLRRTLYTTSQTRAAFRNDAVVLGGHFLLIIVLWQWKALTADTALLALGVTSFLGCVLGIWQIRTDLDRSLRWSRATSAIVDNWNFGKWVLGSNLAYWTSGQMYPLLAGGLISVTATGAMRAAHTILGPTTVLMTALDPLYGPRMARTYTRGGLPALRAFVVKLQLGIMVVIGGYSLCVALFAEPILRVVYGPEYAPFAWILMIMSFTMLLSSVRKPTVLALKAIGATGFIFKAYLASTTVNLTLGVAAVYLLGLTGVGIGLIANSLVLHVALTRAYHQQVGSSDADTTLIRRFFGAGTRRIKATFSST